MTFEFFHESKTPIHLIHILGPFRIRFLIRRDILSPPHSGLCAIAQNEIRIRLLGELKLNLGHEKVILVESSDEKKNQR